MVGYPVLVIDDHELFSAALTLALRGDGFDAHQIPVPSVREFLAAWDGLPTGLVMLDLDLGLDPDGRERSGVDLVRGLRNAGWRVLVVTGALDSPAAAAAIAGGAIGLVPKTTSFDTLLETLRAAVADEPVMTEPERGEWLTRHYRHRAREREHARLVERLTKRERQVLEELADGHRAAEIADRFVVSVTTVRSQIRSTLRKLEVNSQLEAVALVRQGPRW